MEAVEGVRRLDGVRSLPATVRAAAADLVALVGGSWSMQERRLHGILGQGISAAKSFEAVYVDCGGELDEESDQLLFEEYCVPAVPCLLFFRGGAVVGSLSLEARAPYEVQRALQVFDVGGVPHGGGVAGGVGGGERGGASGAGGAEGEGPEPMLLFISGDRSSVGKTTTSLAVLSKLVEAGVFSREEIAYIKPATQCEKPQPITLFCEAAGIDAVGIGPIVFYKGFTRSFLSGDVPGGAETLLREAVQAVRRVGRGKKLVVVDGVGYPAVGSICGVSNADVCEAIGAPVLLVGKSGVGDAVDSFNLNAAFFEARGLTVLGAIFNKLDREGYYSLESCRSAVAAYFRQFRQRQRLYGFAPKADLGSFEGLEGDDLFRAQLQHLRSPILRDAFEGIRADEGRREELYRGFKAAEAMHDHVDAAAIVRDVEAYYAARARRRAASLDGMDVERAPQGAAPAAGAPPRAEHRPPAAKRRGGAAPAAAAAKNKRRRTREEIEAAAMAQGAKKGS